MLRVSIREELDPVELVERTELRPDRSIEGDVVPLRELDRESKLPVVPVVVRVGEVVRVEVERVGVVMRDDVVLVGTLRLVERELE